MSEIKKILYATDLSKNSAYAFHYAADLAEKNDALIHILHVMEEIPSSARAVIEAYLSDEQLDKIAHKKGELAGVIKERLNVFCENVQKRDPQCVFRVADIEVKEGYPSNEILNTAKEAGCDIIVMGTHGKGVISHALLGSVAEKVLRRTKIPVLVIPIPEEDLTISFQDI
jgi:nucleotide-binding universal stress UspA family protein